jgi:DNA-binding SARP family transcriptional activator
VTDFESGKVRSLLAYLAVESDRSHRRDELAALLWPDQPNTTALNNLRQALANLRRALHEQEAESPCLTVTRETVRNSWPCCVPVSSIPHRRVNTCRSCAGRWQEALALYRGDFLAVLTNVDSVVLEDWIVLWRERLHELAISAMQHLGEHFLLQGDLHPWN